MLPTLIYILATYRISYMFVEEQGPFEIFARIRKFSLQRGLEKILPFECFYCTSVWIGLILSLFSEGGILYGLALSAGSIIVYELIERLNK